MNISRHNTLSYTSLLLVLALSFLLISCKGDDQALEKAQEDIIGYDEFNEFKALVLSEIASNKEAYQDSHKALSENYQQLSNNLVALDKNLFELQNRHQEKNASFIQLEKDLNTINRQQQSLSERLNNYLSTKKQKQKKATALQQFPYSLSSIAIWNNRYVVYMKGQGQYLPVRINDTLGHWRLTEINYDSKRVVFQQGKTKQSIVRTLP